MSFFSSKGAIRVLNSLLICLVAAQFAFAMELRREYYILNVKPPSVAVADAEQMKVVADIPLTGEPAYVLSDAHNRFLYVLEDGLYRANGTLQGGFGKVAVVDVNSRKLVRTIPLAWNTKNLALTKNKRYVVAVNEGKAPTKKKKPEESGSITIIDTTTNDVAATLSAGRLGVQLAYNSDLSRIAVFSQGERTKKGAPQAKPMVTIFTLNQEQPLAEIPFDQAQRIELSPDEKWLYVLDPGVPSKKAAQYKPGMVHVIDMQAAKLVKSHEVGADPGHMTVDPLSGAMYVLASESMKSPNGRLVRFRGDSLEKTEEIGREPQFVRNLGGGDNLVVTFEDMRMVSGGESAAGNSFIALNQKKGGTALPEGTKTLEGNVPAEVLHLPAQNKIVTTLQNRAGVPSSKVAIIDMKTNKVDNVITTGRGSVKFGKFMGAVALSVAMSSLSYYANYSIAASMNQPYFFYNVYTFTPAPPNLELAASPDGAFVYALNTSTNDVTIIKVADGTVVDKVPVGGGCKRVALAPGGRFVYSYTGGQLDLIDTTTNRKHLEQKMTSGKINAVHVLESDKRIAALASDSVLFWSTEDGKAAGTITGLHQPFLMFVPEPVQN